MKNSSIIVLFLVAILSFSFAEANRTLPSDDNVNCGAAILSGCVGTCGGSYSDGTEAPVSGLYCFDAVSSLCPTNGAKTVLRKNGTVIFSGDTSGGISFFFPASAGDKIEVKAELFNKKTNVVCVWLGNVNITVSQP